MDDHQRDADDQAGGRCQTGSLGPCHCQDDDGEDQRADEFGKHRCTQAVVGPTVLTEPLLGDVVARYLAFHDEIKNSSADDAADQLRDDVADRFARIIRPDAQIAAVTDGLRWRPEPGPMVNAIAVTVMPNAMPIGRIPSGIAPPIPPATIVAQPISTSTACRKPLRDTSDYCRPYVAPLLPAQLDRTRAVATLAHVPAKWVPVRRKGLIETIAVMGTVAALVWEAAHAEGIEIERPEDFRHEGYLHHLRLEVPVGDQTCRVLILRPKKSSK